MKKAFTLIELLVVIGILAILMGVLISTISGGTDSARAARCLTNMKNLATSCNARAMAHGTYPLAGSIECRGLDMSRSDDVRFHFYEAPGWLSWNSKGSYTPSTSSHISSGSWFTSAYCEDTEVRQYALTNGVLWKFVSGNTDIFICPQHRKLMRNKSPLWSYVMNQKFGWDWSIGSKAVLAGIQYGHLDRADRTLMFAELQFLDNDKLEVNTDAGPGIRNDCTLQYERNEVIGFNHPNGKRGLCAHVVFADGHTEKLSVKATRNSKSWAIETGRGELEELTKWLCQSKDVSFNGQKYEKLED